MTLLTLKSISWVKPIYVILSFTPKFSPKLECLVVPTDSGAAGLAGAPAARLVRILEIGEDTATATTQLLQVGEKTARGPGRPLQAALIVRTVPPVITHLIMLIILFYLQMFRK